MLPLSVLPLQLLFLLLPLTLCQNGQPEYNTTTCSANQLGSIPAWASNPLWSTNMLACLELMNNSGWNGADCKPMDADGVTPLGPSFGFYKGERHYSTGGQDCYDQCAECLKKGIQWNQAQTTTCEYMRKDSMGSRKKRCDVGFDYGVWASTGTAEES